MMKILLFLALCLLVGCTEQVIPATPTPTPSVPIESSGTVLPTPDRAVLEAKAMAGDYQAQRDHALALSKGSYGTKDPIAACAWRLVIIRSEQTEIDGSDYTNQEHYCNSAIRKSEREEAVKLAEALLAEMKAK